MTSERILPLDRNAERAAVGAVLLDPSLIGDIRLFLLPGMLADEHAAALFAGMCALDDASRPIDQILLADQIRAMGLLKDQDVSAIMAQVADETVSPALGTRYAAVASEKCTSRCLISACSRIEARAYEGECGPALVEYLQRQLGELAERGFTDIGKLAADLIGPTMERLRQYQGENGGGLPTGLPELDQIIGGLKPKNMLVAAAFTKVGKTAFGLNVAAHVAIELHQPAAFITFEMSADELTERLIVSESGIPLPQLQTGKLPAAAQDGVDRTLTAIRESRLVLDDAAPANIQGLRVRLRMLQRLHKIKFACVDYFQLLNGEDPKARRYDQLVQISRHLKQLATELSIPILVLAQLNADSQQTDRVPNIGDLADCKAIARDANVTMILDRPSERYKGNAAWLREHAENITAATIDVCSLRSGHPAVIQAHYHGTTQRWLTASQESAARLAKVYDQRAMTYEGEAMR